MIFEVTAPAGADVLYLETLSSRDPKTWLFVSLDARAAWQALAGEIVPRGAFDAPAEHEPARWARVARRWEAKHR